MTSSYVELHCHSNYSLLDGASPPEALLKQAAALGMDSLALTDHDAVYGAVRFDQAAREYGIRPLFGAELTLVSGHHLTLLVKDQVGWANLCWLISTARHNAPKGSAAAPTTALEGHTAGLMALSGCRKGEVASALLCRDSQAALHAAQRLATLFGRENFWIELQRHFLPEDEALSYKLIALAEQLNLGYVATNNVHYATQDGHRLQDVLVCIKYGQPLDEAAANCRPNSEYYLKSGQAMRALFADCPAAIANTRRLAEQCQFRLRYGLQDLPAFPTPEGLPPEVYLKALCEEALPRYLPEPSERAGALLGHELDLITRSGLANYFLVVWDIVRFTRESGIRCQGRGSAANSLVAYLLGISPINPLAYALVFERFLSDERRQAPDIDIDFQADRREEVIQYIYERYGHAHAAMACTFVTFREKSAIREVGKALGLPIEVIEQRLAEQKSQTSYNSKTPGNAALWAQFDDLCRQIIGFPRHLGIHNGGVVLMADPLSERVATEPATMEGRVVIQFDKESLEDAGLIKIDILGLRMLSVIAEASQLCEQLGGSRLELERMTPTDPAVFDMICEADTIGVFQVESRAQAQVLPRLQPRCFEDLVVSISLIRPGPIQGQMVHPYLRRRLGEEPVRYLHPLLEPVLAETLGVILYQEGILKVAEAIGRLTRGQGELLRRALAKGSEGLIEELQAAFMQGAAENGVPPEVAGAIFGQMRAFGGYSFPKSHAAAFAVLVYQSAWLKRYHPAAFVLALLNQQPMGFWSPEVIVNDARRHGVEILSVDIQCSAAKCTLEGGAVRLGFSYAHGLGKVLAEHIEQARGTTEFSDLADFCRRVALPRKLIENLILIGAMDGWGVPRRRLLWELAIVYQDNNPLGLRFSNGDIELPSFSDAEMLYREYQILGLSVDDHLMRLYRVALREKGYLNSQELMVQPSGAMVKVAGQVAMHQAPPTAKGVHFLALEDEEGLINVIVQPDVYKQFARVLHAAPLLFVEGRVQRKGKVINVLASQIASANSRH